MASQDSKSSSASAVAVNFQTIASDTTTVGTIIDSQGFESLIFSLVTATVTDGDYALILEDGDDSGLSDAATVTSTFLVGSLPAFTEDTDDNLSLDVGYIGKKRYVRASVVSTNFSASGAVIGSMVMKGHKASRPSA